MPACLTISAECCLSFPLIQQCLWCPLCVSFWLIVFGMGRYVSSALLLLGLNKRRSKRGMEARREGMEEERLLPSPLLHSHHIPSTTRLALDSPALPPSLGHYTLISCSVLLSPSQPHPTHLAYHSLAFFFLFIFISPSHNHPSIPLCLSSLIQCPVQLWWGESHFHPESHTIARDDC